MKINKSRKYYLVLDTETANMINDPLVYDLGYIIIDKQGRVYKSASFIVSDIFVEKKELMNSCYYAEKLPMYYDDIKVGKRKVVNLYTARKTLLDDIKAFNVEAVLAYNAGFDRRALNTTQRYETKSKYRYFIPYDVPIWCIWNIACHSICNTKEYIEWCLNNGFVSARGNIKTSAEVVFAYIADNPNFCEDHTALEDAIIEAAIFAKCVKKFGITKLEKKINCGCWRIPQKTAKELGYETSTVKAIAENERTLQPANIDIWDLVGIW